MWSPTTASYHVEGVIHVFTLHKHVGWGELALGGEVWKGLTTLISAVPLFLAQMVPSLETPGKQGKQSFTTCKDLGAESQNQPNSKTLRWSTSLCAAQPPPARACLLGSLLTLTTRFLALGQGSQCSGFGRNCLSSESSSPRCCRVLGWCPGWGRRKAGRAWLQAAGPSHAGPSFRSVCVFKALHSRSAILILLPSLPQAVNPLDSRGEESTKPRSVIGRATLPAAALKRRSIGQRHKVAPFLLVLAGRPRVPAPAPWLSPRLPPLSAHTAPFPISPLTPADGCPVSLSPPPGSPHLHNWLSFSPRLERNICWAAYRLHPPTHNQGFVFLLTLIRQKFCSFSCFCC